MRKTKNKIVAIAMAVLLAVPMLLSIAPISANADDITNDSTGTITINDVKDDETFTAIRFIDVTYDGALHRAFAPGFSYGMNANARSDRGLDAYLALTSDEAQKEAIEQFANQVTDNAVSYTAVASDGKAVFDNLPMGRYVIFGDPLDETRVYQTMAGYVEPVFENGEYGIVPVGINAKYLTRPASEVKKTVLEIKKEADTDNIYRYSDVQYTILVNPAEGSAAATNVTITDNLSTISVEQGMQLNQDVSLSYANGTAITDATVNYITENGNTVGFEASIPGQLVPGDTVIVTYTGNTENLVENATVVNKASVGSAESAGIADELIITGDEETINPELTPLEQFIQDIGNIVQTGDGLPFIFGSIALIAVIIIIVVAIRRRRK